MKARVAERGQVTIPKALREQLGIRPGAVLDFQIEKGRLVAVKAVTANPVDEAFGSLSTGRDTDDILSDLRGEL
ncbi:MAG: AbrB/MazE/SpoVT family DNA-binding domain-containing protein [Magnetococcales bacterium]|nr:AbrB/MazE/SpoVT family DNA-binding domain-containing protein [Magnetococcales bacterium]